MIFLVSTGLAKRTMLSSGYNLLIFFISIRICKDIKILRTLAYSEIMLSISLCNLNLCILLFHLFSVFILCSVNMHSVNLFEDSCNSVYSAKVHKFIPGYSWYAFSSFLVFSVYIKPTLCTLSEMQFGKYISLEIFPASLGIVQLRFWKISIQQHPRNKYL
jgi:hypothetical protein